MPKNKYGFIIDSTFTSPNVDERISSVVIHYTAVNLEKSLKIFNDPNKKVSAHYLIPETPIEGKNKIFQLAAEPRRAWHAGVSTWQKRSGLNDTSIGIELVNESYEKDGKIHYLPFTDHQINLLILLVQQIVEDYKIHPTCIVGHDDIAPGRKSDPGPLFPWEKLHEAGIGAWYDKQELKIKSNQTPDISLLQKNLRTYGYPIETTGKLDEKTTQVISAFQMHFRPSDYSGNPDPETIAILDNLIHKYFPSQQSAPKDSVNQHSSPGLWKTNTEENKTQPSSSWRSCCIS